MELNGIPYKQSTDQISYTYRIIELEKKITQLIKENLILREENEKLREQLRNDS